MTYASPRDFIRLHIRLTQAICRLIVVSVTIPTIASQDTENKQTLTPLLGAGGVALYGRGEKYVPAP